MSHVGFTYSGASPATITATGAFNCWGYLGLYELGPSRGNNLVASGQTGRLARSRTRDQLDVELNWTLYGTADINGTASATDIFRQARLNLRAWHDWFDAGRTFTVTLVDGDVSWTGEVTHEDSDHEWFGSKIQVAQLIVVAAGGLTLVES